MTEPGSVSPSRDSPPDSPLSLSTTSRLSSEDFKGTHRRSAPVLTDDDPFPSLIEPASSLSLSLKDGVLSLREAAKLYQYLQHFPQITRLDLTDILITPRILGYVMDGLDVHSRITSVAIRGVLMDAQCLEILSAALQHNGHLLHLNIEVESGEFDCLKIMNLTQRINQHITRNHHNWGRRNLTLKSLLLQSLFPVSPLLASLPRLSPPIPATSQLESNSDTFSAPRVSESPSKRGRRR